MVSESRSLIQSCQHSEILKNTCEFWKEGQAFGKQMPLNIWPKSQQENYNGLTQGKAVVSNTDVIHQQNV